MKTKTRTISKIKTFAIFVSVGMFTFAMGALTVPRTANAQASPSTDLAFDMEDMDFILDQIKFAERHAAGEELADILPNLSIPWGLRTVDGSYNNLIPGREVEGAADQNFKNAAGRVFPDAQDAGAFGPPGPTSYNSAANVTDSTPRLISHLIVNQSTANPAAVSTAAAEGGENIGPGFVQTADELYIPNTAPDEGLSAPFNAYMTFFGQFFDHGLDLINKGGNGMVFMPLQEDDPLFDPTPGAPNFMAMTRATRGPGEDGIVGTDDDTFLNATTPHVDQQQTYGSHASAQILLRHYDVVIDGRTRSLQNSGRLLDGFGDDRRLDTADDGGMATWDTVQAQAAIKFGILLDDQ
ncbi:hypothetical protein N8198_06160, partial [Gammaproteobacteria bacterium]|nr:hypothetical protein [Gammaproteobacteria bacterium]